MTSVPIRSFTLAAHFTALAAGLGIFVWIDPVEVTKGRMP